MNLSAKRVYAIFSHHGTLETHPIDAISETNLNEQIQHLEQQDLVFTGFKDQSITT